MNNLDEFRDTWKVRSDKIRGNRDFLAEHGFKIEAQVQDMVLRKIESMLIDLDIARENEATTT